MLLVLAVEMWAHCRLVFIPLFCLVVSDQDNPVGIGFMSLSRTISSEIGPKYYIFYPFYPTLPLKELKNRVA